MEFKMYGYNVTSNDADKNEFGIFLANYILTVNGTPVDDENKIIAIKKALEENKEDIIKFAAEKAENYKGGRQKNFAVKLILM